MQISGTEFIVGVVLNHDASNEVDALINQARSSGKANNYPLCSGTSEPMIARRLCRYTCIHSLHSSRCLVFGLQFYHIFVSSFAAVFTV